jgi:hypothetical protein
MSKVFPKWSNVLPMQIGLFLIVLGGTVTAGVTYYFTPKYTRVGYTPVQPVPFNHALHTGQLGIDCRYCHLGVDQSPHATVPSAQTCMNCHSIIKKDSPLLAPVRSSYQTGDPVPWVRVHQAPDFVYFNHAVHVSRGVSCVECHGNVTTTREGEFIGHRQPFGMAFCLDCHRQPASFLREPKDVYNLNSPRLVDTARAPEAANLVVAWKVKPPLSCSGCHR